MTPLVVVSTGFRCPERAIACTESVAAEGVPHYYIAADPETFCAASQCPSTRAVFWSEGQIANLVRLIGMLPPAAIVVHLDGDDTLAPGAIERVRYEYDRPDTWLTYGSFVRSDGVRDFGWHRYFGMRYPGAGGAWAPSNRFRASAWRASHLRTFRAGLFNAIPHTHLIGAYADASFGFDYFRTCVDRAIMLALLEFAGERYSVIQDVLCVYNLDHARTAPLAERAQEILDRDAIHAMRPLEPLSARPW